MIDFSQYPPMSVISVECDDGDEGFVVRQRCSNHSPYILVREGGLVARIDKYSNIISSYDEAGFPIDGYRPSRVIAVLGTSTTTVIREKDDTSGKRYAVIDKANQWAPLIGVSLEDAVAIGEKDVEDRRSGLMYIAKIEKTVQQKTVAVTSDYEPEVVE